MEIHPPMHILRLAYTTQFLLALLAIFVVWSEIGGQSHLDLMPWYLKLVLGGGAAAKADQLALEHGKTLGRVTVERALRLVGAPDVPARDERPTRAGDELRCLRCGAVICGTARKRIFSGIVLQCTACGAPNRAP